MTHMKSKIMLILAAVVFTFWPVSAQGPTCRMCPATYIPSEEVQAYLKRAVGSAVSDQQVRAIDIGKAGHVAIGLVYRGKLSAPGTASVAEHDLVSEVYHVMEGSGTLVTGPELVDAKPRPANNQAVRELNGPGSNADSIRNPITYNVKAGDVVVIPAGTGHWWTKIEDHVTYLMVRLDPDKATPIKDEAASKADLARPVSSRGR